MPSAHPSTGLRPQRPVAYKNLRIRLINRPDHAAEDAIAQRSITRRLRPNARIATPLPVAQSFGDDQSW